MLDDPTRNSTKSDWKDVFAEYEVSNGLQIRAGKFKVPFGLDQTAGETNLDFIYRSLGGDYLSMGRDIGGAVHGRFFKRGLNYWAGAFQHDGEHSRTSKIIQNQEITVGEAGVTGAGRVNWANRWVKIQLNTIHESISDAERAPTPLDSDTTKPKFWTTATLMQVEF